MSGKLPTKEYIQELYKEEDFNLIESKEKVVALRQQLNEMYSKGELLDYAIPEVTDPLLQKLLNSNNTRNFKY